MFLGLYGLTAMLVSFWAVEQPVCEPTGTIVSPLIWSRFGAGLRYGFGLPTKSWHRAESAGSSAPSSSLIDSSCLSSGLCRAVTAADLAIACRALVTGRPGSVPGGLAGAAEAVVWAATPDANVATSASVAATTVWRTSVRFMCGPRKRVTSRSDCPSVGQKGRTADLDDAFAPVWSPT